MMESLRNIFLNHLPLKLIAFVLSLVLFIVVRSDRGTVTTVEIPIHMEVSSDYVVTNEPAQAVRVQIRGTWSELRELRIEDLGPIMVSPPPRKGQTKITFDEEQVALPPGLRVESFDPPSILVEQDERAVRTVSVAVERALSGSPPPGYQLGELKVEPSKVEIVGPQSVVEMVNQVFVEPIDLTGRTASFVEDRYVVPDRRSIDVVGEGRVSVSIDIVPKARQRVVRGIPILVVNLARPFEVLPESVDLVLVGEEAALENVDPSKLVVTLDGSSEAAGPPRSRQLDVEARNVYNLPPGVAVDESRLPSVFLRTHSLLPQEKDEQETPDGATEPGKAPGKAPPPAPQPR